MEILLGTLIELYIAFRAALLLVIVVVLSRSVGLLGTNIVKRLELII